jgi:type III secretory pathway component EscT
MHLLHIEQNTNFLSRITETCSTLKTSGNRAYLVEMNAILQATHLFSVPVLINAFLEDFLKDFAKPRG